MDPGAELIPRTDGQCPLRRQRISRQVGGYRDRIARAAGGKWGCKSQRAVMAASKYRHLIVYLICQDIHGACVKVPLTECCSAERRQHQQADENCNTFVFLDMFPPGLMF